MSFTAFNYGVNVIAFTKNGKAYGMTCAWSMQVDYDKALMLLGSQSVTGRNIEKGDIVGISALSKSQLNDALFIGDNHSDNIDKFENIKTINDESAILLEGSSRLIKARVIDVIHLDKIEVDNLIYLEFIDTKECNDDFLNMSDIK